jgi:hypothetical protein
VNPWLARVFPVLDARSVRIAAIVTVLGVLVAVVGGGPLLLAVPALLAGSVIALALRGRTNTAAQEYGLLPVFVVLGFVTALANPSLLVGILAGATGLAVLLWNAESPRENLRAGEPLEGLVVPGLGLGVALLTALALPAASSAVGVAAVAVVLALGVVVWALRGALEETAPTAKAL